MYVYADILIITNIYTDFLLIKSAAYFTHSPLKTARACIAAAAGSLFSLVIFLPRLPYTALIPIKLAAAALTVYIAFGYDSGRIYLKRLFVFWLASFLFAGAGTAFSSLTGGSLAVSRNGVIYADFSMASLVITTIAAYACIAVYRRFSDNSGEGGSYTVTVSANKRVISFKAIADSGNILRDSFTGKAVIVCSRAILSELYKDIPDERELILTGNGERTAVKKACRWRFIPITTVTGSGLIPITHPDSICIKCDETGRITPADAYLGAAPEENEFAVFHPRLLLQ